MDRDCSKDENLLAVRVKRPLDALAGASRRAEAAWQKIESVHHHWEDHFSIKTIRI
jgi:hypothetical protein